MKKCICLLALTSLMFSGCFYIAPIDEDAKPEDESPYINMLSGVSPVMGLVNVNLSLGGNQEFIVSSYGDDNLEQPLYHRVVMDYRPAGVSANPVFAVVPKRIDAGARDRISYAFAACTAAMISARSNLSASAKPSAFKVSFIFIANSFFSVRTEYTQGLLSSP